MALQESYNSGDDSAVGCYNNNWYGQSFTAESTYTQASIKLLVYKVGSPGNITVNLYLADGTGKPTGVALATATLDGNSLTTNSEGEWKEITWDAAYGVTNGLQYVIMPEPTGTSGNALFLRRDVTSPAYSGGTAVASFNNGSSWTTLATQDFMFETYSGGPTVYTEGTLSVTGTGSVSLVSEPVAWNEGTFAVVGVGSCVLASEVVRYGSTWPNLRGSDYDPDLYWDEETETWVATRMTMPGAFQSYVVFVGEEGEIYFSGV